MQKNKDIFRICCSGINPLSTFKRHENGHTAEVIARIVTANGLKVPLLHHSNEVAVIDDVFLDNLVKNYKISTRRPYMIGKVNYPRVLHEHVDLSTGVVGTLAGPIDVRHEMHDNRMIRCAYVKLILTQNDIIDDLEANGMYSDYAKVSIGAEFMNGDLTNPLLDELSLTKKPKEKNDLLMSEAHNDKSYYDEHPEEYLKDLKELRELEESLELIRNNKKTHDLKTKMSDLLDNQIYLNRMTRANKKMLMSEMPISEDAFHALQVICKHPMKSVNAHKKLMSSYLKPNVL